MDLMSCVFEGKQKIKLKIQQDNVQSITCHGVDLWARDIKYSIQGKGSYKIQHVEFMEKDQAVRFHLPVAVQDGDIVFLEMKFGGVLNDLLQGLYRSQYVSIDGEKKYMAVTQFEACDARRAFFCWDEPAIKAKFEVSVVISLKDTTHLEAISNTPVKSTNVVYDKRTKSAMKTVRFEETPIMSTYLVALIVGEFDKISTYSSRGVLVTVYTPLGKSDQGKFALNVGEKALSLYETRYGIDYPLRKLDMLAIPDFAAGAMENWGAITYRETRLLIDEGKSSIGQKKAVSRTVCHELVHQWFGNLVTMEWWTSLWLNEGFARFMEFDAVNTIFPEWNVWETFVQSITLGSAMGKDAMETSHPIEVVVHHPDEVDQIFDVISYAKGASMIRMLSNYLGQQSFDQGIHDYLTKYSYNNAITEQLWDSIEQASHEKFTDMMNGWTKQTGFPVVTLQDDLTITQQRFLSNNTTPDTKTVWSIPMTLLTSNDPNQTIPLGIWHPSDSFSCTQAKDTKWFVLNPSQSSFYIVNYTKTQLENLHPPIASQVLSTVDRVSILSASFKLARNGTKSIIDVLQLLSAYAQDPSYLCWEEISSNLSYYLSLFKDEPFMAAFKSKFHPMYLDQFKRLTWSSLSTDDENTGSLRRNIIAFLSKLNPSDVQSDASRLLEEYLNGQSTAPDLRSVLFNIVASTTEMEDAVFIQLTKLYLSSDFNPEKLDCLVALGKLKNQAERVLEWCLQNVRSQDIMYPFFSISATNSNAAWLFVQQHWSRLNEMYPHVTIGRIVNASIGHFHDQHEQIEHFLKNRQHSSYSKNLQVALEAIRIRGNTKTRDLPLLRSYFNPTQAEIKISDACKTIA